MRDASDELAVFNGCWFDERRGQFVVDWLYDYLRLYEGEDAGKPFECRDWQYEATMRLFGWTRKSEEWCRTIRRFRKAIIFVAKKNKKSPTLAAWTTYMAFGDGVMGQKCFPTAVDGRQVRENVMLHIHAMIEQSEALAAECQVNRATGSVYHRDTRSVILPLSSDNVRTQKANEGLNGSVFVDEVHVVSKEHMRRIIRAGISRAEPLHAEASTVGDEPESYGMGRFRYAEGVIAGTNRDDQTLAIIHAAPQDVSDREIHADPVKYGKMANPSWGHTVKQCEFLSDYETSKASLSEFADFKKYRLNIWQQSANPWLSIHDWRACGWSNDELNPSEPVYAGLDLSRTTDLTAWLLFQPGPRPKCIGHYWCPRERAMKLTGQHEIPLLDWAEQGWLTLTDESPIPRRLVHERIQADAERYSRLKYVGYDRALVSSTVEFCRDDLGLEPVDIAQGVITLNAPSVRLEEMVSAGSLDHSGDPVLAWMATNTAVRPDSNGNIKPLKTVGGTRKHIDGIVALVMAICVSMSERPKRVSTYATPGMLTE